MRLWMYFVMLMMTPAVLANSVQPGNPLTLNQAILLVLDRNPQLRAAAFDNRAAAARVRSAILSPALRATLTLENFAGSGPYTGSNLLESTLSLSKIFETGNKSDLRSDQAKAHALLLQNEQDAQQLDLLSETTKRFIHVVTDQARLAIAIDSLKLAEQTLAIVQRRVQAGRTPDAELRRAENFVARKQLELEHAEHELATTRLKLTTLWGETQVTFSLAQADLFVISLVQPFEQLASLLQNNPDLARFATHRRLSQTRIQLAQAKASSDIEFTAGLRHFHSSNDTGFVMSLSMPFASAARAQPQVDEAEALSQRDPQLQEQQRLNLYTTLFEVHQEIRHAIEAVRTLNNIIIPNGENALKEYKKGYTAGRYSFMELTESQNSLLAARLEAVMVASKYHSLRAEIDRLIGASTILSR